MDITLENGQGRSVVSGDAGGAYIRVPEANSACSQETAATIGGPTIVFERRALLRNQLRMQPPLHDPRPDFVKLIFLDDSYAHRGGCLTQVPWSEYFNGTLVEDLTD